MRAIHVRIGHNDDFVVTQFIWIIFFFTNTRTQCRNQRANFGRANHFIKARTFNVEDFTFKWQNCLGFTATALFG